MNPIKILLEAVKNLPAMRYALGIVGIISVIAITASWGIDYRIAVFGSMIVLILMAVLVLFARLASLKSTFFHLPAMVLTWFSLILLMCSSSLLFTAVFFNWPSNPASWFNENPQNIADPNNIFKPDTLDDPVGIVEYSHVSTELHSSLSDRVTSVSEMNGQYHSCPKQHLA